MVGGNENHYWLEATNVEEECKKELKKGKNTLRREVTNLGSNRIKAKEARGEEWKNFYEINMVSLDYQPFDASRLDVLKSGLLEDPILIPLENSP